MSVVVPLKCQCGEVRGAALDVTPTSGIRVVCYCDDCQVYAYALDRAAVLDANGGTDIYQLWPSRLRIEAGGEHLRCLRLSEKGLLRWYAGCCGSPVGNTPAAVKVPCVGVVHTFMDHAAIGRSREELLGPPARIQGRFARGSGASDVHRSVPVRFMARSVSFLFRGWRAGAYSPSPFFVADSKRPAVEPKVLTSAERRALAERLRG